MASSKAKDFVKHTVGHPEHNIRTASTLDYIKGYTSDPVQRVRPSPSSANPPSHFRFA